MSIINILKKAADYTKDDSPATKLRRKRFLIFNSFVALLPRPLSILDVGGTQIFWERMNFTEEPDVKIVLLNLSKVEVTYKNFISVQGDARRMDAFTDQEFDVVFSNSVIEHVGGYDQQCQMANEVKRVGKSYFIQTPNRFFPFEPHFLLPFFQFLPLGLKIFLVRHFDIGWHKRTPDKQKAAQLVNSIRLLTEKELKKLFPGANIYKEKLFGLTKSLIVYEGWDGDTLSIKKEKNKNY